MELGDAKKKRLAFSFKPDVEPSRKSGPSFSLLPDGTMFRQNDGMKTDFCPEGVAL